MSYILNIDTATETATVCLSNEQVIMAELSNTDQKNHAAFIQPAIAAIMQKTGIHLSDIDAVAVTAGPGSYTGLRVGMATAKGICFSLNKPLITVNTLEVMALAAIESADNEVTACCPLIDARRMEVFTAIYDRSLTMLLKPQAMVLEEQSFADFLDTNITLFSGSGMKKLSKISGHPNARFSEVQHHATHLAKITLKAFTNKQFADLAYSEPIYLKPFFDTSKK